VAEPERHRTTVRFHRPAFCWLVSSRDQLIFQFMARALQSQRPDS